MSCIIVYIIYSYVLKILRKKASKTKTMVDDFVIDILRLPVLWLLFFILLTIFSNSFLYNSKIFGILTKLSNVLLILTIGWILIKVVRAVFYYMEQKLHTPGNEYNARKGLTKLKIFEGIIVALITVITVAVCLMTFEKIRSIGVGLLSSAGIVGIIAGFAAQKSIGAVFAGIQIAITQPIRIDDSIIVQGNSGVVEEINITYVVLKLWDGKRMIFPINYFLENSFQNLTHNRDTGVLGTVFLYVDYRLPVDDLRNQLTSILDSNPKWDKRTANIQVTDSTEKYKVLRVLFSTADSGSNWDLSVDLREKLIDFISKKYPDYFVRTRIEASVTEEDDSRSTSIADNNNA